MPALRCDFHMHTKYLKCANGTMEIPAMIAECERLGVEKLAITDHLNTLDQLALHRPIRQDIEALDTPIQVYFAVELNYTGPDQGFAYSEEIRDEMGFQFAIGGIHSPYLEEYDPQKLVEIQHRHHIRTCLDPLVHVLVHPYWFGSRDFERRGWPWFDSMSLVPTSLVHELGQAARDTGTAIEINACANLANPRYSEQYVKEYIEFLAILAEEGACFSLGSDAHDINRLAAIQTSWQVADELGLTDAQLWRPSMPPLVGGAPKK